MRVLIVGFAKIKYMPYLNLYLESMDYKNNEVHLAYWDRDSNPDIELPNEIILHRFAVNQQDQIEKYKKIFNFCRFRKFVVSVIKNNCYDYIILLHTFPAVLLCKELISKFNKRYIFDYRDSTFEWFYPFKKIIQKLVLNSKYTFVSSDGFRKYMPDADNIFTSHNLDKSSLKYSGIRNEYQRAKLPIRVGFWGFIRDEELNRVIIERLGSDERFELHYYGREQDVALNLKKYVFEKKYNNVFFHGEYLPAERFDFAKEIDVIHNIYCDKNMMIAMPNKYYDGIIFEIPQVFYCGSFMGELADKANIGVQLNPNDLNFSDKLYNYYLNINFSKLSECCKNEIKRVFLEYDKCIELIKSIFNFD